MASALFLQRQYEDVLLYFNSIKPYLGSDETFKFNYAQVGHFVKLLLFKGLEMNVNYR